MAIRNCEISWIIHFSQIKLDRIQGWTSLGLEWVIQYGRMLVNISVVCEDKQLPFGKMCWEGKKEKERKKERKEKICVPSRQSLLCLTHMLLSRVYDLLQACQHFPSAFTSPKLHFIRQASLLIMSPILDLTSSVNSSSHFQNSASDLLSAPWH